MMNLLKLITAEAINFTLLDLIIFLIASPILAFFISNQWIVIFIIFLCFLGSTILEVVVNKND